MSPRQQLVVTLGAAVAVLAWVIHRRKLKKTRDNPLLQGGIPSWKSHEIVQFTSGLTTLTLMVEIFDERKRFVLLSNESHPYHRLRVDKEKSTLFFGEGGGSLKDCFWTVSNASSPDSPGRFVHLRFGDSPGSCCKARTVWWLANGGARSEPRGLCSNGDVSDAPPGELLQQCTWRVQVVAPTRMFQRTRLTVVGRSLCPTTRTKRHRRPSSFSPEVGRLGELTGAELNAFVRDGYVVCRGTLAQAQVDEARAFINARVGLGDVSGEGLRAVGNAPEVVGLLAAPPIARLIAQLLGGAACVAPTVGCQVALRFPNVADQLVTNGAACRHAVGGRDWHTDGLRQGKKHSFSLLVGVALSDTTDGRGEGSGAASGRLHVWPGSHRICQALMRWPDGKIAREPAAAAAAGAESCSATAVSWDAGRLPDLGPATALALGKGDVVLAHHALAHCGGPNLGADVRYMLYYRVRQSAWHTLVRERAFEADLFCDLPGTKAPLVRRKHMKRES